MSDEPHELEDLLERGYGLRGELTRLGGVGENFLVEAEGGGRFVLKLLDADLSAADVDFEQAMISAAARADRGLVLPHVVPTRNGELVATLGDDPARLRGRLLDHVEGTIWREALPASRERFCVLGGTIGRLANELDEMNHPVARRTHDWDPTRALEWRARTGAIDDRRRRQIVEEAFHRFAGLAAPVMPQLPHGVIHSDLNDENLLVTDDRVTGILDFADCLYNPTVCELGVALAYLLLDEQGDPWSQAAALLGAYHQVRPLRAVELGVIYPLMISRLAVSVVASSERRAVDPQRVEWFATEQRAWRALERWIELDPIDVTRALAAEIELDDLPVRRPSLDSLLQRRAAVACDAQAVRVFDDVLLDF